MDRDAHDAALRRIAVLEAKLRDAPPGRGGAAVRLQLRQLRRDLEKAERESRAQTESIAALAARVEELSRHVGLEDARVELKAPPADRPSPTAPPPEPLTGGRIVFLLFRDHWSQFLGVAAAIAAAVLLLRFCSRP